MLWIEAEEEVDSAAAKVFPLPTSISRAKKQQQEEAAMLPCNFIFQDSVFPGFQSRRHGFVYAYQTISSGLFLKMHHC